MGGNPDTTLQAPYVPAFVSFFVRKSSHHFSVNRALDNVVWNFAVARVIITVSNGHVYFALLNSFVI